MLGEENNQPESWLLQKWYIPSRFEPTVEHLINPTKLSSAFLRWDGEVIDFVPMNIRNAGDTGQFFKLGDGSNADDLKYTMLSKQSAME